MPLLPSPFDRRALLGGAAGLLAGSAAGCHRKRTDVTSLRLGFFPNLTHAPALTGITSGRFASALGRVRLDQHAFNAGPAAIEALMANALDATYVGPSPAAAGFIRSHGTALVVVAGAASGGASFVVRRAAGVHGPADLHGKRLASPQIGNTQDIALRHYLAEHGLRSSDQGGDVNLTAVENSNIFTLFQQGALDGAWVPEPWASRLVLEAGGEQLVDERDLWPNRAFAITLLVVRSAYLRDAPDVVDRLVDAHAREVGWIHAHDTEARALVQRAIAAQTSRPLPAALIDAAWPRIDFTADALRASVETGVQRAHALGLFPSRDLHGFFDDARIARARALAEAPQ